MIYHSSKKTTITSPEGGFDLARLEKTLALAVEGQELIQWHDDDHTLVAEADYEVVGKYVKASGVFKVGDVQTKVSLEDARPQLVEETECDAIGESDKHGAVTFFALRKIRVFSRKRSFPAEVAFLVEFFVDCMKSLPDSGGGEQHRNLVALFFKSLDSFLGAYKGQSEEDFTRYVEHAGLEGVNAQDDLDVLRVLYDKLD